MLPYNSHIVFFFIQLHCLQPLVQHSVILGEPASFSPTFSGRNLVTSHLSLQAGGRCPAWVLQKCPTKRSPMGHSIPTLAGIAHCFILP